VDGGASTLPHRDHLCDHPVVSNSITVVVVDDHAIYRESIVDLLSLWQEFSVLADFPTFEEALPVIAELRPSLILLDVHLPGIDGITGSRQIETVSPSSLVVLCSTDQLSRLEPIPSSSHIRFVQKGQLAPEALIEAVAEVCHAP
jgi:two-component system, NarL family, response regulator LiaR